MQVSARSDYGLRAMLVLAAAQGDDPDALLTVDHIAREQGIPAKFLEGILRQLRLGGLVVARRGADGGFRLAVPAREITVADVIRALDGPLADVHGIAPEDTDYPDSAVHLREVWIAVRSALRSVLERTTLADVRDGRLPRQVTRMLESSDAWTRR